MPNSNPPDLGMLDPEGAFQRCPQPHTITLSIFLIIAGKYVNHKGRSRHFTSVDELEEERKKKALK